VNNAENYGVSASMVVANEACAERVVTVFRPGRVLSDPVLNEDSKVAHPGWERSLVYGFFVFRLKGVNRFAPSLAVRFLH
jgi:hypothetical protein